METLKYKRVLLKVSGEALAGDAEGHRGINFDVLESIAKVAVSYTHLDVYKRQAMWWVMSQMRKG